MALTEWRGKEKKRKEKKEQDGETSEWGDGGVLGRGTHADSSLATQRQKSLASLGTRCTKAHQLGLTHWCLPGMSTIVHINTVLNWNNVQWTKWNTSWLPMVTGDGINRQHADKQQTDTLDSNHHMIDWSVAVQHKWPNMYKHGLCTLNYYYIYLPCITVII